MDVVILVAGITCLLIVGFAYYSYVSRRATGCAATATVFFATAFALFLLTGLFVNRFTDFLVWRIVVAVAFGISNVIGMKRAYSISSRQNHKDQKG